MMFQRKPLPGSKFVLSLGLIIVSVVYAVWQNLGGGRPAASPGASPAQEFKTANDAFLQTLSQIGQGTGTAPAPAPTPQPMMGGPMMRSGAYVDGSYTGAAADAYYGMVQVKVVVRNGKVADVQFLQYPNDRSTSIEINSQAMPLLTQEAIAAQSAQVDGVSGATETSMAFQKSLASALVQAK